MQENFLVQNGAPQGTLLILRYEKRGRKLGGGQQTWEIHGKGVGGNGWREANIWGTVSVRIKRVTLPNPNITG